MPIVVIGLSHHSAPVGVRERLAFPEADIPAVLKKMREQGVLSEGVILSTCNRVEVYAATEGEPGEASERLRRFVTEHHGYGQPVNGQIYAYSEPRSLEHLCRVASGLDSMVPGETEILGQVKKAYDLALQHKMTGGRLNRAFQKAFHIAKLVRTGTNIQRGSVSVGSAAVELAEKIFSTLRDRQVMVIGAGDTSEKTARALLSRGAASIIVSNRSHERAEELARELGGRAARFEDWPAEFPKIDIVISSTSAPHYVIDRVKLEPLMRLRKNRPLLLIDIAVPRDIEPEVNFLENVYLYNIDDLQAVADDYLQQRREEIARCEAIIREKVRVMVSNPAPRGAGEGTAGLAGEAGSRC
jgi:glutamyl-tRNA reductase